MLRVLALALLLTASACSMQVKPDDQMTAAINNHAAVLTAITAYINDLQEKGVLPKPQPPEVKE